MSIRCENAADFMIRSLTYHNSKHIYIEKDTTACTTDLQDLNLQNFYKMNQQWW